MAGSCSDGEKIAGIVKNSQLASSAAPFGSAIMDVTMSERSANQSGGLSRNQIAWLRANVPAFDDAWRAVKASDAHAARIRALLDLTPTQRTKTTGQPGRRFDQRDPQFVAETDN